MARSRDHLIALVKACSHLPTYERCGDSPKSLIIFATSGYTPTIGTGTGDNAGRHIPQAEDANARSNQALWSKSAAGQSFTRKHGEAATRDASEGGAFFFFSCVRVFLPVSCFLLPIVASSLLPLDGGLSPTLLSMAE